MDILKGVTFEKLVNFVHDKQVSITLTIESDHTSIDIYPYNSTPAVWPIPNPFAYGVDEGGEEE